MWHRCPVRRGGGWGRGGVVGLLVCGGRGGYGAWWHGMVGLLRFRGLLVGLWRRSRECQ